MRTEYSDLSLKEYRFVATTEMTPAQICAYLESEFKERRFYPALQKMYPRQDLEPILIDAFLLADPAAKKDTIERRLRTWKSGSAAPNSRETIFLISFALGLSEEQASYLLGFVSDYGIHYREGRELAYAHCLRAGKTYSQAKAFYASLPPVPPLQTHPAQTGQTLRTQTVMNLFSSLTSDEEFRREYSAHLLDFGAFHLRAYDEFKLYHQVLRDPAGSLGDSVEDSLKKLSAQKIMEILSLRMPVQKDLANYSVLQRMIKSHWPNETILLQVAKQKKSVTRKLLLLLCIVTDNIADDDYFEGDEAYLTPQQRLKETCCKIDLMLDRCGMNPLDPRNAYDWLVFYSLNAPEESMEDSMANRMQEIIECLFASVARESTEE